uniref:Uncharacterized protein n=1 Tax=Anguilla anguilla TaxID=7936 RepID=A0A0E9Y0I3_ANGAN
MWNVLSFYFLLGSKVKIVLTKTGQRTSVLFSCDRSSIALLVGQLAGWSTEVSHPIAATVFAPGG